MEYSDFSELEDESYWDNLWENQMDRDELLAKIKQKKGLIKDLFTLERTVSDILMRLRVLNKVRLMALNEVFDKYEIKGLHPLKQLADGWSYSFPNNDEDDYDPEYLLQRNGENMAYVINIDKMGIKK